MVELDEELAALDLAAADPDGLATHVHSALRHTRLAPP